MKNLSPATGCLTVIILTLLTGGAILPAIVVLWILSVAVRIVWSIGKTILSLIALAAVLYLLFH